MKRLTLNQDSEIKVKDIYGKMHDCKDVPREFYGCIRKLYDYEIQDTQLILLTTYRIYSKICVNAY